MVSFNELRRGINIGDYVEVWLNNGMKIEGQILGVYDSLGWPVIEIEGIYYLSGYQMKDIMYIPMYNISRMINRSEEIKESLRKEELKLGLTYGSLYIVKAKDSKTGEVKEFKGKYEGFLVSVYAPYILPPEIYLLIRDANNPEQVHKIRKDDIVSINKAND